MTKSKIEWTDVVWNPTVGCSRVSEGCRNCYAERFARRLVAMGRPEYQGLLTDNGRWNGMVRCLPERLYEPLRLKKPSRIFVDSMSDLFHENMPYEFLKNVWTVMTSAEHHKFLVLTKRPNWMKEKVDLLLRDGFGVLKNVWLGVSIENQQAADERIPLLLETPAAVRFVSCEPLLGPVKLHDLKYGYGWHWDSLAGFQWKDYYLDHQAGTARLDWVICGGESGPGARPMHPDWARSLRDQCQDAGVPFFFKQWGEWLPVAEQYGNDDFMDKIDFGKHCICLGNRGTKFMEEWGDREEYWCGYQPDPGQNPWFMERVGKKAAGRELDGRTWEEYPDG
ncbi:hypothetical protein SY88_23780 [Clostridiales bacterium PH28_bin88]|nr:hypothetical protein SY88_23780 [Clostridiales bacterium PH28_bin88]